MKRTGTLNIDSQPAFTCSQLTTEAPKQGVRNMLKVNNKDIRTTPMAFENLIAG